MGTKLTRIPLQLQSICRSSASGRFQYVARRASHTGVETRNLDLAQKLNAELPKQISNGASIYRVPDGLRSVEPKAYEPNIVSIGPYHHGVPHLQAMEETKRTFIHGLFSPDLNAILKKELKQMEPQARTYYSDDLKFSSQQFIDMLLLDSCFIIQLLRETSNKSVHMQRWKLPVLQRDLIMLENQLPMFVLNKVYDLISTTSTTCDEAIGLKELALQYFESMIYKDLDTPNNGALDVNRDGESHFLELFRASICPTEVPENKYLVKEPHMFRSVTELKESGVQLKKAENCQPLDVSFRKGVLKIAPVSMDDYRFTLFRNMVAFEQCHSACKPYVTAYVFFLDRLINSAEDIELLHYSGVMQHTLGGNKNAARLVNNLCKEVAGAVDDSYLRGVLWKINCYCNDGWNQKRAKLKHEYFYNVWVSVSTMAAILIIYLTILQTIWALGDENARTHMFQTGFWGSVAEAFAIPFGGFKPSENSSAPVKDKVWMFKKFFGYKVPDDMNPFFFMSC